MSVKWSVTIDCAQPATLTAFWNLALGYVDASPPERFASWPEWFRAFGVPPEEWDDGPISRIPAEHGRLFRSSRSEGELDSLRNRAMLGNELSVSGSAPPRIRPYPDRPWTGSLRLCCWQPEIGYLPGN
jgi:hypothetical protein